MDLQKYYKILDVPEGTSPQEIKARYRQLVRIFHPDNFTDSIDKEFAEQGLQEIVGAYHTILKRRQTYQPPPHPYLQISPQVHFTLRSGSCRPNQFHFQPSSIMALFHIMRDKNRRFMSFIQGRKSKTLISLLIRKVNG